MRSSWFSFAKGFFVKLSKGARRAVSSVLLLFIDVHEPSRRRAQEKLSTRLHGALAMPPSPPCEVIRSGNRSRIT